MRTKLDTYVFCFSYSYFFNSNISLIQKFNRIDLIKFDISNQLKASHIVEYSQLMWLYDFAFLLL